jgi:hypothetical protein
MTDTLDTLVDRAARGVLLRSEGPALRAAVAELRAELGRLREGEEPYDDDEWLVPTPAQWIWRWNRATPAERLARAERVIADWSAALALRLQNQRVNAITTSWGEMTVEMHQYRARAEQVEAQLAAVRALHHDDYGLCHACTGSHGVPWPCPTIAALDGPKAPAEVKSMPLMAVSQEDVADWAPVGLPRQPAAPTLAAMAELAAAARAEYDAERRQLETAITTTVQKSGLAIVRTDPVEQVAAHPAAIHRLRTEIFQCSAPSRQPGQIGRLTDLPVIPDDTVPPGEIHLRPHPRPDDAR